MTERSTASCSAVTVRDVGDGDAEVPVGPGVERGDPGREVELALVGRDRRVELAPGAEPSVERRGDVAPVGGVPQPEAGARRPRSPARRSSARRPGSSARSGSASLAERLPGRAVAACAGAGEPVAPASSMTDTTAAPRTRRRRRGRADRRSTASGSTGVRLMRGRRGRWRAPAAPRAPRRKPSAW